MHQDNTKDAIRKCQNQTCFKIIILITLTIKTIKNINIKNYLMTACSLPLSFRIQSDDDLRVTSYL